MSDINELSFEQAFDELQEVIIKLESGDLTLEDSVEVYERGKALSEYCQKLLNNAELKVSQLADSGDIEALDS